MTDDVPPELIEAARKRREEAQCELAAAAAEKSDGVTRRSQLRRMSQRDLEQLAAQHGVELADVTPTESEGCLVCVGAESVDDAPFGIVQLLCADHADAVSRRVREAHLRPVIPVDLHDAQPADLLAPLQEWSPNAGGVYLYGPVGTGKSHQAAALVKRGWKSITAGASVDALPDIAWRNVPMMMDDIAATFGARQPYDMRPVAAAQLLVLDDIGFADNMPFAVRKLYNLIEHRLNARLCTIVTSNRDLDDLGRYMGAPQIASRLAQICGTQVDFDGMPDRRPEQATRIGETT